MKSSFEIGLVLCCPTEKGCIPGRSAISSPECHIATSRGSAINYEDWCFANQSRSLSLSRESSTSETVASPRRAGEREFERPRRDDLTKKLSRHLPHGFLWIRIYVPRAQKFERDPAQLLERVLRVVSICRSLSVVDPFLRQSDGAAKRLLRSSKRPFFAFTLVSRVYGSHDPGTADLRGHHDDLHGTDAAYQACRFDSGTG